MVLSKTISHFGSFPYVVTTHIGIGHKNFNEYCLQQSKIAADQLHFSSSHCDPTQDPTPSQ